MNIGTRAAIIGTAIFQKLRRTKRGIGDERRRNKMRERKTNKMSEFSFTLQNGSKFIPWVESSQSKWEGARDV